MRTISILTRQRAHVVACSIAATWGWSRLMGVHLLLEDLVVVPLVMFSIYLWNQLFDVTEDDINDPRGHSERRISRARIQLYCGAAVLLALCLGLFRGQPLALTLVVIVCVLGFLYSTPFLRLGRIARLKDLVLVKNLTSSAGWSILTVLYPALHASSIPGTAFWIAFAAMFAMVLMVEMVWDIRDMHGDLAGGVMTVPLLLGSRRTRQWLYTINLVSSAMITCGVFILNLSPIWLFVLTGNAVLALITRQEDEQLKCRRKLSHLLVLAQTILFLTLGILAGIPLGTNM